MLGNSSEQTQCSICLSDVVRGSSDAEYLPCTHVFHRACIKGWNKPLCPVCRTPYSPYEQDSAFASSAQPPAAAEPEPELIYREGRYWYPWQYREAEARRRARPSDFGFAQGTALLSETTNIGTGVTLGSFPVQQHVGATERVVGPRLNFPDPVYHMNSRMAALMRAVASTHQEQQPVELTRDASRQAPLQPQGAWVMELHQPNHHSTSGLSAHTVQPDDQPATQSWGTWDQNVEDLKRRCC